MKRTHNILFLFCIMFAFTMVAKSDDLINNSVLPYNVSGVVNGICRERLHDSLNCFHIKFEKEVKLDNYLCPITVKGVFSVCRNMLFVNIESFEFDKDLCPELWEKLQGDLSTNGSFFQWFNQQLFYKATSLLLIDHHDAIPSVNNLCPNKVFVVTRLESNCVSIHSFKYKYNPKCPECNCPGDLSFFFKRTCPGASCCAYTYNFCIASDLVVTIETPLSGEPVVDNCFDLEIPQFDLSNNDFLIPVQRFRCSPNCDEIYLPNSNPPY